MKELIERGAELIRSARTVVAFTGAGISAESGIPTYRGAGGLWKSYDPSKYANINYFFEDPSYYWNFFKDMRYQALVNSKPNPAHLAIAKLEKMGKLSTVITQNIDGLHLEAGNSNVIELHGNTKEIGCLDCGASYGYLEIYEKVKEEIPPTCDACSGRLKPKVVFFGEQLPPGAVESGAQAASTCDVMLVVGSTLEVYPAASIPIVAKRKGAKVIIVNVGETAMDEIADLRLDAKAGEVLPLMVENGS